jgi:hypothetical protein
MNKIKIERVKKGIVIKQSEEYRHKKERESRILERKIAPKLNPSNKDIYEYLNDTNERLSEIYDLLK